MPRASYAPHPAPAVDESLFGYTQAESMRRQKIATPITAVSASTLNKLLAGSAAANPNDEIDSIVLTRSEIQRFKEAAVITSKDEQLRQQHSVESAKKEFHAKAKARKERMLQLEKEAKARTAELSPEEQEELDKKNAVLQHAATAVEEQHDDVKHMNQMVLYAQCAAERERQLVEKAALKKKAKEDERALDIAMEAHRQKVIDSLDAREQKRRQEQKKGAAMIEQQMKERELDRLRAREQKEQEAQQILQEIAEREAREAADRQAKAEQGKKLLHDIMTANNEQARAKIAKKQEAIQEDLRIAAYLKQKEAKDAEKEAEAAQRKAEKEREIGRLRAQQEKAHDRQAEIDALRAKRYQEAAERKLRARELAEAQKKADSIRDMAASREAQKLEAQQRLAEQVMQEKAEYDRILNWQKQQTEADRKQAAEQNVLRAQHRAELLDQITRNEQAKVISREQFSQDGRNWAKETAAEHKKLEQIKQQKLAHLEKLGVPEKFRAELAGKKVLQTRLFKEK